MLEGTRTTLIYFKTRGAAEPRFDEELDDKAVKDYAYDGWLPLTLSGPEEDGLRRAAMLGDPWVTTPPGTEAPPEPGPAPVRITAAECSAELRERARLGLSYFIEETPEERGRPYDYDLIVENIVESISGALKAHNDSKSARATLGHESIDHVAISGMAYSRVKKAGHDGPLPPMDAAGYELVRKFVASHHRELVAYAEEQMLERRHRLQGILHAAQRLSAFLQGHAAANVVTTILRALAPKKD